MCLRPRADRHTSKCAKASPVGRAFFELGEGLAIVELHVSPGGSQVAGQAGDPSLRVAGTAHG